MYLFFISEFNKNYLPPFKYYNALYCTYLLLTGVVAAHDGQRNSICIFILY